ncbi:DUF4255 domain-containing protein [Pyxidicoccus parkwayensis]|uniref:DUF4255 domain-containing protein n=1 Tax=Pyxidicoccus parkwayensis TaxID=2813578 RepID=A0ABX7PAW9_9BACT|nr:DUF4255 domain-containing protein [Pyxidicoccus parkwaysis]QSQ27592.1 DUF4255 domain-containing protein [Pyxidicoccus parkwaysis]
MSNSLSVAAITATLRTLLFSHLQGDFPDVDVTTMPPDKARSKDATHHQINIFLFQVTHNPNLRNMEMPTQGRMNEGGFSPLALRLSYMLTAYAPADDDVAAHKVLGKAMLVLHDHAVLGPEELRTSLPGNDLYQQVERVRITPDQLSLEDVSKMWTAFQSQYRISVIYQVSAVLIESTRARRSPLPVLRSQISSQAGLPAPFPVLQAVLPPDPQTGARLGETVVLQGGNLAGDTVAVRFNHPQWTAPVDVTASDITAARLSVAIPNSPATWPAGMYSVAAVIVRAGEPTRTTNALPLALAPSLTSITVGARAGDNSVTLTVGFEPQVLVEQRVSLLVGDREVSAPTRATAVASLAFVVPDAPTGEQYVRLRVDGVDSLRVDRSVTPPVFHVSQRVTLP